MFSFVKKYNQRKEAGFTLMEMAIVLVVIGLILGAVSVGKDLQRNAEYRKITNKFIGQWVQAYNQYYERTGVVPGDVITAPTGIASVADGATFAEIFTNTGIKVPRGRGTGNENEYLYYDAAGSPHTLIVSFVNSTTPTSTGTLIGNLMQIEAVSPVLFSTLESSIDGIVQFDDGVFRCASDIAPTATTVKDETAVTAATCWYKMQQ
ncbi:putative type II secretion system protein [Magnetococcus marinus MC-1]|uniref:Putative type II secretion system protein n=1 Tax=Magnetococcus marinus (strain ATCC BAA-1437 / JCM 17883 / MC-1) TaxID=156889 RepID=A0L658_MAGMM|nr:prepilin-type N-terminal cleavage/methylation domain-containing protein [Magnetococcus marinus]ABK43451.1 putative type II secretion system protein [Magnetococcus marinus MC-1]